MTKDENCIFCKIIEGRIPSYKVYEDENNFAFLTIRPHVKGHLLLIPKNHSEELVVMNDEDYNKLMPVAKRLAAKIKTIYNSPRVSVMTMGFGVAHTHIHIVPISKETDLNTDMAYDASPEELTETQQMLTTEFAK